MSNEIVLNELVSVAPSMYWGIFTPTSDRSGSTYVKVMLGTDIRSDNYVCLSIEGHEGGDMNVYSKHQVIEVLEQLVNCEPEVHSGTMAILAEVKRIINQ